MVEWLVNLSRLSSIEFVSLTRFVKNFFWRKAFGSLEYLFEAFIRFGGKDVTKFLLEISFGGFQRWRWFQASSDLASLATELRGVHEILLVTQSDDLILRPEGPKLHYIVVNLC